MINSQSQKGGDGSANIQTQQMVVNIGIDEKRAREIYQEMNMQLRHDYSREAFDIAKSRVAEFESKLMPKMSQVNGAMEAFADPGFQLLLVEAQKKAASTERSSDYDLLSELLIHRFQKDKNRIVRAGISLAVEIVDKISDEALLGLTVAHAVKTFVPTSGDVCRGLDVLNDLFGKIIYGELPAGDTWLDHLDILDAVRLNPLGGLKKIEQYYPERLSGYVDVGIVKNSGDYDKAIEVLGECNVPSDIMAEHPLNSSFVRLRVPNVSSIDDIFLLHEKNVDGELVFVQEELSERQRLAVKSIYELYSKDGSVRQANVISLMNEWDKRQNLKALREWWDRIPSAFSITSVGKVLAHSNAQRCDKGVPPLD